MHDTCLNSKENKFIENLQQLVLMVKNKEKDIFDISLLEIIETYLGYLLDQKKESVDLDITANFLVMIANLILWKSSGLLPLCKTQETEEEKDDNTIVTQEDFWREYRKYQSLIKLFEEKEKQQENIFLAYLDLNLESEEKIQENNFSELILALESVLSKKKIQKTFNVKKRKYNILEKISEIEGKMKESNGKISFTELINENCTRLEIIVLFLALLELICQGRIKYVQSKNFDDIIFFRKEDKKSTRILAI